MTDILHTSLHLRATFQVEIEVVSVNQANPIGNLKEFIITCEAVGSKHMVFHWFKDDMKVQLFISALEQE